MDKENLLSKATPNTYFKASQTSRLDKLRNGLRAYYPLISNGDDYSGNNNHGQVMAGVKFGPGLFGGSAAFEDYNTQTYIKLPHVYKSNYEKHYTLSAWINRSYSSRLQIIGTIVGRLWIEQSTGLLKFSFDFKRKNSFFVNSIYLISKTAINFNE